MKKLQDFTKNYRFLVFLFLVSVLFCLPLSASLAKADNDQANIYLSVDEVYEEILFAVGANLDINATINDDVYAAGGNVIISGPVSGDVIAAGSNIIINGDVKGNLRVAGANVTIKGKIGKNATIFAGMITITPEAEIGQSLIIGGANVEINGKVYENVYGGGSNVAINSEIMGDVYLTIDPLGDLVIFPDTNIHGSLEYSAGKIADVKEGAIIQEQEKYSQIEQDSKGIEVLPGLKNIVLVLWFIMFLSTLVVALIIVYLFKDFTLKIQKVIKKNILILMLKGLIIVILTPIIIILLSITVIGIPLAMILTALYLIALFISKIFVAVYIGDRLINLIYQKGHSQLVWSMVLGLAIIFVLCLIPYIGWLFKAIITLWGLGSLYLVGKEKLHLDKI